MNQNLSAAQTEAIGVADAWLNNAELPLASQMIAARRVEVAVRNVYGNPLIYPANDTAKKLAALTGKKTLDKTDLANIQALGFAVFEVETKKLAA